MKTFELSNRKSKNGRRKFKAILHEIYPDSCVDAENECGTIYNLNGITWIKAYCEAALPSIKDMSLRVEFLNEERDEIHGHGDTGIDNGMPLFEDATVIGHFTKGYIDTVTDEDGNEKLVCCGEGYIDEMCYSKYVSKLDEEFANDEVPHGSIEIYRTEDNDGIKYLYGYKEKGRIPSEYIYSGFAFLGVRPADDTAKLLELNAKKEDTVMNEQEIKAIVEQTVSTLSAHVAELNQCKADCETKIAEANEQVAAVTAEKNELQASSEAIQKALDEAREELSEKYKEIDALYEELNELREELGKAKARERVGEMNSAIASFSDEEKAYAKDEIAAFEANPVESEINSVVNKIWEGIGKKAKADADAVAAAVVAEQNSAVEIEDIFSEVVIASTPEDTNIF